jgi:hypothetical protein
MALTIDTTKLKAIPKSKAFWAVLALVLTSVGVTVDPTIVTTVGCSLVGGCG